MASLPTAHTERRQRSLATLRRRGIIAGCSTILLSPMASPIAISSLSLGLAGCVCHVPVTGSGRQGYSSFDGPRLAATPRLPSLRKSIISSRDSSTVSLQLAKGPPQNTSCLARTGEERRTQVLRCRCASRLYVLPSVVRVEVYNIICRVPSSTHTPPPQ